MSMHSLYIQSRLANGGHLLGGAHLMGGGFFGDMKKSMGSLATNVYNKGKAIVANAAPILLNTVKDAGKSALNAILSGDGSIKDRLTSAASAGLNSFDRGELTKRLYQDAVRPVF